MKRPPRVLVCAGLEPAGRAGLLADLEVIRALGGQGLGVATALTAQGSKAFHVRPVPPLVLRQQLRALLELGELDAVKLGMVPSRAHLAAIRRALRGFKGWWVIDPVTHTSRGERLSTLSPADYLKLAGPRAVLTPNVPELAWLTGSRGDAKALLKRGFGAVIVKGGHGAGKQAVDLVVTRGGLRRLAGARLLRSPQLRGTGCRFASALAVGLGRGMSMERSARLAKERVRAYLAP